MDASLVADTAVFFWLFIVLCKFAGEGYRKNPHCRTFTMARKATEEDKLSMLQKYECFMFDLDGTVWKGNKLVDKVAELIELLRYQGKKVFFVTNNSSKSRAGYAKKLTSLGLAAKPEEIFTSAFAAALYLKLKQFNKKVYVVGEEGIAEEMLGQGISTVGGPADNLSSVDWSADEPHIDTDPEIGAVVVGLDRYLNYYKLQYATLCLQHPDCQFLATNMDSRGNFNATQEWAGAGAMVAAVMGSSEREPTLAGKPASFILDHICHLHNIKKSQICVLGDRLDTDILWGNQNGCGTCLVLTGVTSEEKLLDPSNTIIPTYYVNALTDLLTVKDKVMSYCVIS